MSLLIKNGTIVDGSGAEKQKADILIKGDEIVEIGVNLSYNGARVIDAEDRIVSPGFIDIHNHADMTILDLPKNFWLDAKSSVKERIFIKNMGNIYL